MLAQVLDADPWKFQWHPEVWLLVAFLTGAYVYTVRVIGPIWSRDEANAIRP